jgi:hypothetical protein
MNTAEKWVEFLKGIPGSLELVAQELKDSGREWYWFEDSSRIGISQCQLVAFEPALTWFAVGRDNGTGMVREAWSFEEADHQASPPRAEGWTYQQIIPSGCVLLYEGRLKKDAELAVKEWRDG